MLYLGVIAAVAIAVLLVVVFVLPGSSSSGSAASVLTYSGALPVANGAVAGFEGGGWTPIFAAGFVSATNETERVNSTSLGNITSYCSSVSWVSGVTSLTLSGYTGNRSSGASPAWAFGYRNQSDALAVVTVLDGHAQVLLTLSGGYCSLYAQLFMPIPGNVIDSSQAAAAVQPDAAAFLAAHPNASAEYGLTAGVHLGTIRLGNTWSILYNSCPLNSSTGGTGDQFNATVNATNGQVLTTHTSTGVSCGSTALSTTVERSPGLGAASVAARAERTSAPA
jgi:hypothetical protein